MKNNFLRLISLFIIGVIFVLSCSKDENNAPKPPKPERPKEEVSVKGFEKTTQQDTVKMKQNVILVKKDIYENTQTLNFEKKTIIYADTEATKQINEGDILYSLGDKNYPDGYALKVVEVKRNNGKVTCSFKQARIDEVFDKYNEKIKLAPITDEIQVYDIDAVVDNQQAEQNSQYSHFNYRGQLKTKSGSHLFVQPNDRRLTKFEVNSETASLSYIIFDADGDMKKTKSDQLCINIDIDYEFPFQNFDYDPDNLHFSTLGSAVLDIDAELVFGQYNDKTRGK